MKRTAAAGFWLLGRACARTARRCLPSALAAALLVIGLTFSGACRADPVKGEATFSAADGYARLVLKLAEDVESEVTTAGSIVVIRFKRPVDIPIDILSEAVPDYVGSARRDPDGSAIRLSLARRVTINTMTAGERIFIDLLPDTWNGPPPALPAEVIRELAARARAAERALRQQRAEAEAKKRPPIRVRTSVQPTFVRFAFEMPDGVGVSSVLNEQKLTLRFNATLAFDLADAKEAAPPNIASINQKVDGDSTAVEVVLIGDVDVHSFREDKNYIVDVAFQQAEKPEALPSTVSDASHAPAPAAPAPAVPVAAAPAASEKRAAEPAASRQAGEIAPLTSETFAKAAKIEIKPEAAPKTPPVSEPAKPERAAQEMPAPTAELPQKPAAAASEPPNDVKAEVKADARPGDSAAGVDAVRSSEGLNVTFSFATATPAALFRRADTVWLVFDSTKPIDVEPIRS